MFSQNPSNVYQNIIGSSSAKSSVTENAKDVIYEGMIYSRNTRIGPDLSVLGGLGVRTQSQLAIIFFTSQDSLNLSNFYIFAEICYSESTDP